MRINYEIPLKILESFKGQISTFVNFGSVLENYVLSSTNGYLKSKKMLANALKDWKQEIRILDFKLHTVYGGLTNPPHMLVGHLERIIRERSVLLLSSGKQIREYHHVDDLVPALVEYIEEEESSGEIAVNTGQSLRIREMVFDVMKEFRLEKKLQFDRLDDPVDDNYSDFTQPTSWTTKFHFREPIPGITEYLKFRIGN
jgi:nucleoside-diphosphate-sugar epimerase